MLRLEEMPFDSDRKLMSTKYELHGVPTMLTKGAVDVLSRCTIREGAPPRVRAFTEADWERIPRENMEFSRNGLRVLAFAYKEVEDGCAARQRERLYLPGAGIHGGSAEGGVDTGRIRCQTGRHSSGDDHRRPQGDGESHCEQIGIFSEGDMAVTGAELDGLSDQELEEQIDEDLRLCPGIAGT